MSETNLFLRFGVAMFIGILIGMQREIAFDEPNRELPTGVRTFALLGLLGCAAAMIGEQLGEAWVFVGILAIPGLFLAVNYFTDIEYGKTGLTTEVSAVLTMLIGALAYWNFLTLAVALGVVTTALLTLKFEMHRFAQKVTRQDVYSTLKFAVITAIVLPVLPNEAYGPGMLKIFNPFKIWLLVVFISGISFAGYVLMKFVGARRGIGLTGFLGGLASSTAVTLSFAHRSRDEENLGPTFALAIILAWTVMFARVIIEVAAVNSQLIRLIWLPIVAPIVVGFLYCFYLYRKQKSAEKGHEFAFANPFELRPAIKFGLIFTLVLLISKLAQTFGGNHGIYASSFLAGLADVDAIALSMAELSLGAATVDSSTAAHAIIFAAIANTLAKGGIVVLGGAPSVRRAILPGMLAMIASSIVVLMLIEM